MGAPKAACIPSELCCSTNSAPPMSALKAACHALEISLQHTSGDGSKGHLQQTIHDLMVIALDVLSWRCGHLMHSGLSA